MIRCASEQDAEIVPGRADVASNGDERRGGAMQPGAGFQTGHLLHELRAHLRVPRQHVVHANGLGGVLVPTSRVWLREEIHGGP